MTHWKETLFEMMWEYINMTNPHVLAEMIERVEGEE